MLNRREALIASASAAAVAALPWPVAAVVESAPAAVTPAWAVGTPGEFDCQHIVALTEDAAKREFCWSWVGENKCVHAEPVEDCECDFCEVFTRIEATRVTKWDGKEKLTSADWLRGGLGCYCSRCGYETFTEENGHPVGDEAVCEECMTLADWEIVDPERAAEMRTAV